VDDASVHGRLEGLVARVLDARRDPLQRPVPGLLFPSSAARRAVEDLLQASWIVDQLNAGGALAAERALADRMGGVALDVDHRAALSGHDLAAPDSAEWADRRRGGRAGRLQRRQDRAASS